MALHEPLHERQRPIPTSRQPLSIVSGCPRCGIFWIGHQAHFASKRSHRTSGDGCYRRQCGTVTGRAPGLDGQGSSTVAVQSGPSAGGGTAARWLNRLGVGESHETEDRYATSLAAVLRSAAVPYGVTLTVWASGASVSHYRGAPRIFEIFLFALDGVAGYTTTALSPGRAGRLLPAAPPGPRMLVTGMLHAVAVGVALGAVTLIGQVESWVAWPLAGFAGIGLYLTLVGAEHALAPRLSPGLRGSPVSDRRS